MKKLGCLFGFHNYGTFHNIRIDSELQKDAYNNTYSAERTCSKCHKTISFRRTVNKCNVMICTKWRKA